MIGNQVWHKTFGYGCITDISRNYILITFETHGEKKISNSVWGTILFFSIKDFQDIEKEKVKTKYNEYLPVPELQVYDQSFLQEDIAQSVVSTIDQKMLLEGFDGAMKRNIVIILCQKTKRGNKIFLRIIGIDVFTGKTVNIVDTNGSEHGLHSYSKEFAELSERAVIQAEFKMLANKFHLNTLRIVSPICILGKCNVRKLRDKYKQLYSNIPNFVHSFDEVFEFCNSHKSSRSYFIVNFTGTKIQAYKNRYQLKMDNHFVDIRDIKFDLKQNGNEYYHGWAIVQCDVSSNGEYRFSAQHLFGKFLNKDEFKEYRKKRIADYYNQDSFTAYESEELEDEDIIVPEDGYQTYEYEYKDEYLQEQERELAETYKQYATDTLDEYSEYAEEEGNYDEDK